MTALPSGLLLLDKPAGVTSFDCVHKVKRKLGAKRVGHCGTLDPAARGLLMILVGSATRAQDSFLGLEKEYWFCSDFGIKTATADLESPVIERRPFDHVSRQKVEDVLESFLGPSEQLPPLYSALKYKGKPYYHYARQGLDVPRTPRTILISSFSLLSFQLPSWEARVVCSRGTYIRTLAEDVAERLGTCATLTELVRDRVGPYKREQAMSWGELEAAEPAKVILSLQPLVPEAAAAHA